MSKPDLDTFNLNEQMCRLLVRHRYRTVTDSDMLDNLENRSWPEFVDVCTELEKLVRKHPLPDLPTTDPGEISLEGVHHSPV